VDAIERTRQIHGARAQRIVDSALHMARKVGPPPQHLSRWRLVRPFPLVADTGRAGPSKSGAADADAIPKRLMVGEHKIQSALSGAHNDSAWRIPAIKGDGLALDRRSDRLQLRIERAGEDRGNAGAQKKARPNGDADESAAHDSPRGNDEHPSHGNRLRIAVRAQLWRERSLNPMHCRSLRTPIDGLR
jgi:hypothetical protein